jgi:hypothetical protein
MAFAEQERERGIKRVKALQRSVFMGVSLWAANNLERDSDGKLSFTVANLASVSGAVRVFEREFLAFRRGVLSTIVEVTRRLIEMNADYFEAMDSPTTPNAENEALRAALLRWGYDNRTGEVMSGSYLDGVFGMGGVGRKISASVNSAIASGMTLAEFQQSFRSFFVGGGVLESHWRTNAFDLYQRIDRAANYYLGQQAGFANAVYSGTIMERSRPFCIERVSKIYTVKEIAAWEDLEFQGKPKIGYDPFFDCGGFNCRHHLSFVSDGVAEFLRKKQV